MRGFRVRKRHVKTITSNTANLLGKLALASVASVVSPPQKIESERDMMEALGHLRREIMEAHGDIDGAMECYRKNGELMKLVLNKAGLALEYDPVDEKLLQTILMLKMTRERRETLLYEAENYRERLTKKGVQDVLKYAERYIRLAEKINVLVSRNEDATFLKSQLNALQLKFADNLKKLQTADQTTIIDFLAAARTEKYLAQTMGTYSNLIKTAAESFKNYNLDAIKTVCLLCGVDLTKDPGFFESVMDRRGEFVRQFLLQMKTMRELEELEKADDQKNDTSNS